ncbi:hypothetical protein PV733_01825 [Streptomyces europaeiscabiei]|nr:hypothetical protein [Streptomyces europaeiscabiei]MDX3707717.1 hypothetical protein [Streptomyces europaeiscabiei]
MKSARGTGLYWRISMVPSEVPAAYRAAVRDSMSRTSAAKPRASMSSRADVEDVGGEAAGLDVVAGQLGRQALQALSVTGDEGDGMAGGAEAAGGREPEAGAGADEGEGGHGESLVEMGRVGAGFRTRGPESGTVCGQGFRRVLMARRSSIA